MMNREVHGGSDLVALYDQLHARHGARSDPDTWWPVYAARSSPPEFERAITNVLVQRTNWRQVQVAVAALDQAGLLTARALAAADPNEVARCIQTTGLHQQKARSIHALCSWVMQTFDTEQRFCAEASRAQILAVHGAGLETADRLTLYVCGRLAWPVDAYCLRVLTHYHVIPAQPDARASTPRLTRTIQALVQTQLPPDLGTWRRLHALMQLEGSQLPPATTGIKQTAMAPVPRD